MAPVAAEDFPATQPVQLEDTAAPPVDDEYLPPGQLVQELEPVLAANEPLLHAVHALAPNPAYCPAAQVAHAVGADAPLAEEKVPARQLLHAVGADAPEATE